jgi:hypothetical protein
MSVPCPCNSHFRQAWLLNCFPQLSVSWTHDSYFTQNSLILFILKLKHVKRCYEILLIKVFKSRDVAEQEFRSQWPEIFNLIFIIETTCMSYDKILGLRWFFKDSIWTRGLLTSLKLNSWKSASLLLTWTRAWVCRCSILRISEHQLCRKPREAVQARGLTWVLNP